MTHEYKLAADLCKEAAATLRSMSKTWMYAPPDEVSKTFTKIADLIDGAAGLLQLASDKQDRT
jgi:hypothetical protein